MAEQKSRFLRRLETFQIIVEITAILVGGFWTYLKFIRTEEPFFERTAKVDRDLSAAVDQAGGCLRTFSVTFTNTGKSVLTVKSVRTRVWKFQLHTDKEVELVDIDNIETQNWVFQKQFPDPIFGDKKRWYPFLRKYRPGEYYSHSFDFLFKKEDAAWIFLKTELFIQGEDEPQVAGMWAPVCG